MAAASSFTARVDAITRELNLRKETGGCYGPRIEKSKRAIVEDVPLVDLVIEFPDAKLPLTSVFKHLKICCLFK